MHKKDNIALPWVDAELIFLGKYIKGANYMQNYMQNLFNCNECYFTFIKLNTNTHMKKQHYLALGWHYIDGTIYLKLNKSNCNECKFTFVKFKI